MTRLAQPLAALPDQIDPRGDENRILLSHCDLDEFERGLLPVLRHIFRSLAKPEQQSWHLAYSLAAERWGETLGLSVAHALCKVIQAVERSRPNQFDTTDPLEIDLRQTLSQDEQALLLMLNFMRRDLTAQARAAVADVTGGRMDSGVIRAGLSFAARFPAGTAPRGNCTVTRPQLRVVR